MYQPDARLPVLLRHGDVTWVIWEKRKTGGSANSRMAAGHALSIKSGKWKPWRPRPVLIPADSFMEKDRDKQSHWITLAPGMAIQALLAARDSEQRVYVVTEKTPAEYHWIHDRWPRLRKVICSIQI